MHDPALSGPKVKVAATRAVEPAPSAPEVPVTKPGVPPLKNIPPTATDSGPTPETENFAVPHAKAPAEQQDPQVKPAG